MKTVDTLKTIFDKLEAEDKISNEFKNEVLKAYSLQVKEIEKLETKLNSAIDTLKHLKTLIAGTSCVDFENLSKVIVAELKEEIEKLS